jgi:hypothetical protein
LIVTSTISASDDCTLVLNRRKSPFRSRIPANTRFPAAANRTGDIPSHGSATSSLPPLSQATARSPHLTHSRTFETNGKPAIPSLLSSILPRPVHGESAGIRQTSLLLMRRYSTRQSRRSGWLARSISMGRILRILWGGYMGGLHRGRAIIAGASKC